MLWRSAHLKGEAKAWLSSRNVAILAILTAIPTAGGYVVGPLSHAVNDVLFFLNLHLSIGYILVILATLLARLLTGKRGSATFEGLLLGMTGLVFHPGAVPPLRFARDLILGVTIDLCLLKDAREWKVLAASVLATLASFTPYWLFVPFWALPLLIGFEAGDVVEGFVAGALALVICRRLKTFGPCHLESTREGPAIDQMPEDDRESRFRECQHRP